MSPSQKELALLVKAFEDAQQELDDYLASFLIFCSQVHDSNSSIGHQQAEKRLFQYTKRLDELEKRRDVQLQLLQGLDRTDNTIYQEGNSSSQNDTTFGAYQTAVDSFTDSVTPENSIINKKSDEELENALNPVDLGQKTQKHVPAPCTPVPVKIGIIAPQTMYHPPTSPPSVPCPQPSKSQKRQLEVPQLPTVPNGALTDIPQLPPHVKDEVYRPPAKRSKPNPDVKGKQPIYPNMEDTSQNKTPQATPANSSTTKTPKAPKKLSWVMSPFKLVMTFLSDDTTHDLESGEKTANESLKLEGGEKEDKKLDDSLPPNEAETSENLSGEVQDSHALVQVASIDTTLVDDVDSSRDSVISRVSAKLSLGNLNHFLYSPTKRGRIPNIIRSCDSRSSISSGDSLSRDSLRHSRDSAGSAHTLDTSLEERAAYLEARDKGKEKESNDEVPVPCTAESRDSGKSDTSEDESPTISEPENDSPSESHDYSSKPRHNKKRQSHVAGYSLDTPIIFDSDEEEEVIEYVEQNSEIHDPSFDPNKRNRAKRKGKSKVKVKGEPVEEEFEEENSEDERERIEAITRVKEEEVEPEITVPEVRVPRKKKVKKGKVVKQKKK